MDYYDEPYPCPYHPECMIDGEIEDPWAMEMSGISRMMPNCAECYHQACMDI